MAKGFCTCHRYTEDPKYLPPEGAKWHYLCDKPVLPAAPASGTVQDDTQSSGSPQDGRDRGNRSAPSPAQSLASCGHPADEDGECGCSSWPERAVFAPEYEPDDDGETQRIAEVFADARAEQDRGL